MPEENTMYDGNPKLTIGDFTIWKFAEGKVWIERSGGEGGEFTEAQVAEAIEAFYEANF